MSKCPTIDSLFERRKKEIERMLELKNGMVTRLTESIESLEQELREIDYVETRY